MVKVITKPGPKHLTSVKKKEPKTPFPERFLRWMLIVSALAVGLSYLSVFINPKISEIPMFFGYYFIPIVAMNVVLLFIALVRHSYSAFIPVIALLPAIFNSDLFIKFGAGEETAESGNSIRVMTYNVGRYMSAQKGMTPDDAVREIRKLIENSDPDIVCLQEFITKDTSLIGSRLPEYPYRSGHYFHGSSFFGNITLSRYPIVADTAITFKGSTNLCIKSDIAVDSTVISIFNCHLESYSTSFTSVIKRLTRKGYFKEEFVNLHDHLGVATVRRAEQVSRILAVDAENPYPSVICGDFNDTPVSYTFKQLKNGRKDTFSEAGDGFSSTYSVLWPLLRIDYILIPEEFGCSDHKILRQPFSDHYPVLSTIQTYESGN